MNILNNELLFLSSSTLYYLMYKRRLPRRCTAHNINKLRPTLGEYVTTYCQFKEDPDESKFFEYMRMKKSTFMYILQSIEQYDDKRYHNCHGRPILLEQRLVVTIQYLATGRSFRGLGRTFKMHHTTVSQIVNEIVRILWDDLSTVHMPAPTMRDFKRIADDFYNLWNFPHCVGSLDGKHVRIKNVPHSGGMFLNYKHYFSIVLQALVDANYRFTCIDVGNYGKQSDGGTFRYSSLYQCIESGRLRIPEEDAAPVDGTRLPFVIIGDDAYPLLPYLIKPYGGEGIDAKQRNYNKRLSRARRVVEHAFGIIVAKWRLLKKDIECDVDLAVHVVKAICLLHNTIIDLEGTNHNLTAVTLPRHWRRRIRFAGRPSDEAKRVRDTFCDYFHRHKIVWNNTNNRNPEHTDEENSESDVDNPDTPE